MQATTIADALTVLRDDVTPTFRSGDREARCIEALLTYHKALRRLRLVRLTVADVPKWRCKRLKQVAASKAVRESTLLQVAVGHVLNADAVNVVRKVKRPRVVDRRERRSQAGEWQRQMQAFDQGRSKLLRPLLLLVVETAMRGGELLAMEWKYVELQRCTVLLPRTKYGNERTVPLSPRAVEVLRQLLGIDDRVLPLSGDCVRQGFERVRARAQVDDIRFHDLRHEAVSRLVERDLSLIEVQQVSGHRTRQMLLQYVHLQTGDIVAKLHMPSVS